MSLATVLIISAIVVFVAGILAFTGLLKAGVVVAKFVFYAGLVVFVGVGLAILII